MDPSRRGTRSTTIYYVIHSYSMYYVLYITTYYIHLDFSLDVLKGIRGCRPVASLVLPVQFNLTRFRRKLASVLARPYHLSLLLPAIFVRHNFSI